MGLGFALSIACLNHIDTLTRAITPPFTIKSKTRRSTGGGKARSPLSAPADQRDPPSQIFPILVTDFFFFF